ncbi:MAG: hypothetical protein H7Z74_15825 [Anaerolineae bacterium]|nr:hypothetical protein [Gemmatimonadaceae bacterium]
MAMLEPSTTTTTIRGIPVVVNNTRPDIDTATVLQRVERVLALLERVVPHYYRHLRRDFAKIYVIRYACRGAYFPDEHACMIELTFAANPDFSDAQVAASVVHEAMHARLHRLGFPLAMSDRARQERFCRRAEIELGMAVPDGAPVIERALFILENADDADVAPVIDERLAAERVAQVDRAARLKN